jgi:uncharacterized protein
MITICDTGPLLAMLDRRDAWHDWAAKIARDQDRLPVLTCEAVLVEAVYFLRAAELDVDPLFALLDRGFVRVAFDLGQAWPRVQTLMARYDQMDLADACVVAMTEQHKRCRVWTLDRKDFSIYRRNDRQVIQLIAPPK